MGYDFTIISPKNNNKFTLEVYDAVKAFKKAVSNAGYFYTTNSYIEYKKSYITNKYYYQKIYYIHINEKGTYTYGYRGFPMQFMTSSTYQDYYLKFENNIDFKDIEFAILGYTDATRDFEDMVLKVMYEYLKIRYNDVLIPDDEYLYTKDELEKIINLHSYDENWCYKNYKFN